MKRTLRAIAGLTGLMLAMAPAVGFAQMSAEYMAAMEGQNTLSGGSVSSGVGSIALDRARGVAGGYQPPSDYDNPFGTTGTAPPASPFGPGGGNSFGGPVGGGGNPFATGGAPGSPFGGGNVFGQPGGFNYTAALQAPATLKAWGGERIVCSRTGEILQDARELSILATASANYFDDGQSGNDSVAGDNIYTNITVNDGEYISPESHYVKTKLILTLMFVSPPPDMSAQEDSVERGLSRDLQGVATGKARNLRKYLFEPRETQTMSFFSNLTPMQFSQVRVATTEPLSPLPQILDLERKQDEKLRDWGEQFLRDYRVNPDQFDGEFVKTFLPPPPRAPNIPLPATFTPNASNGQAPGQGGAPGSINLYGREVTAGDVFGGDVTGEPIGNASSRYF